MSQIIDDDFIARDLERWRQETASEGIELTQGEIKEHIAQWKDPKNLEPDPKCNGFTFIDMHMMLNFPLEEGCPVQLRTLSEEEISKIPLMRQILFLMHALAEEEIELSSRGHIPVEIVEKLYELGNPSRLVHYKRKTEDLCDDVLLVHITLEQTGLIKKRKGKISMTAKGKKLLKDKDKNELLRIIMRFLLWEFNIGYLDRHPSGDLQTGNVGRLYSLWLLHHYGDQWHELRFYGKEYLEALPFIYSGSAYVSRVYERLFRIIGLCEFKQSTVEAGFHLLEEIRKTPTLDMMFSFEEPAQI